MRRKKILVIDNSIDVTGALKSLLTSCVDLQKHYDFIWVLPKGAKSQAVVRAYGFKVYQINFFELKRNVFSVLIYLPMLLRNVIKTSSIVNAEGIALIHVNDVYNLIPPFLNFLGIKTPYICHIRFMPDRFPKWLFFLWLTAHRKFSKKIICVSKSVQNLLPSKIKSEVIYNELPLEEKYEGISNNRINTFLYLANYIPGKGQNYALKAFAEFSNTIPNWRLRFVGSDMGLRKNKEYLQQLKELSMDLKINQFIDWVGFTEDVEREYKAGVIALNFSESESFSITCLEAMFFGSAIIATRCGGPSEIIDDQQTGLLVENRNCRQMTHAMIKLASDDKLRQEMVRKASINVREKFSRDNTTNRLYSIYHSLLDTQ